MQVHSRPSPFCHPPQNGLTASLLLNPLTPYGEVRAEVKPEPFVCSEAVESIFQGEAVHNLWHCQIANMSCGLSAKGISCEKKDLIEKVFRGVESIFKSLK